MKSTVYPFVESVHRYYESRRRILLDSTPERMPKKIENDRNSKKAQRQRIVVYTLWRIMYNCVYICSCSIDERNISREILSRSIGMKLITITCLWKAQMKMKMAQLSIKCILHVGDPQVITIIIL